MIKVTSMAFAAGGRIPKRHTGEGEDASPALAWSGAPAGTKEFALICDDPDAPRPQPWVHWVLYGIPGDRTSLPEDVSGVGRDGKNTWGNLGYGGPMPPPGHGVHHYHFKLYALKEALSLPAGAAKEDVLRAMQGLVVDEGELLGTYER